MGKPAPAGGEDASAPARPAQVAPTAKREESYKHGHEHAVKTAMPKFLQISDNGKLLSPIFVRTVSPNLRP